MLYFVHFALWLSVWSCNSASPPDVAVTQEQDPTEIAIDSLIAAAPVANLSESSDMVICGNAIVAGYNFNFVTFEKNKEIKWYLRNIPLGSTNLEISEGIARQVAKIDDVIEKPFVQVFGADSVNADIIYEFKNLDGKGDQYGICAPVRTKEGRRYSLVTFDIIDYYIKRKTVDFFFENCLHETGHAVGLSHSEYRLAVMYPYPVPKVAKTTLTIDDAAGLREKYKLRGDFVFNGEYYYEINSGGTRQLTKNFIERELYQKCGSGRHYLNRKCVLGAQKIRDIWGPTICTSSFRSYWCNLNAKGATDSQHQYADALDVKVSISKHYKLLADIKYRMNTFQALMGIGLTGYGSYPIPILHIDARPVLRGMYYWKGRGYYAWGDVRPFDAYQSMPDQYVDWD